jgi:hypothetical protein
LLLELHDLQLMLHIQQLQVTLRAGRRVHHLTRVLLIRMSWHAKLVARKLRHHIHAMHPRLSCIQRRLERHACVTGIDRH